MRIESGDNYTTVTLSSRNLYDLLDRLESGQRASLHKRLPAPGGDLYVGPLLVVQVESDEEHYDADGRAL